MLLSERNDLIIRLHGMGLSHADIAREVNLSRERVRQILFRIYGNSAPIKKQPSMRRKLAIAAYMALESGESVDDIAKRLDLSPGQLDQMLVEQIGAKRHVLLYRQWMSEQIGQTYGDWTILSVAPGKAGSTSKARSIATARCERCGTIHKVLFSNLMSSCSTMCLDCGRKVLKRRAQPVMDLSTGQIYPSIHEAAEALGISYNQARYRARCPKTIPSLMPLTQEEIAARDRLSQFSDP